MQNGERVFYTSENGDRWLLLSTEEDIVSVRQPERCLRRCDQDLRACGVSDPRAALRSEPSAACTDFIAHEKRRLAATEALVGFRKADIAADQGEGARRRQRPMPFAPSKGPFQPSVPTVLRRMPIPGISTSSRSPGAMGPTPAGVPVMMTSPGRSVMNRLI